MLKSIIDYLWQSSVLIVTLINLENVILTQHMGSCSYDCRYQMELQATEDIIRYFNKEALRNEVQSEEYDYQLA